MSRITAVRSITATPTSFSRLRSCRGLSSSSQATRLASASLIACFSSLSLPLPKYLSGSGRGRRCVISPATATPAVRSSSRSSERSVSSGETAMHRARCRALGLRIPSPRFTPFSLGAQAACDRYRLRLVKAFVTGGTGFIGQHLVQKLRERGDEVIALVRSRDRGQKLAAMGSELHEGDLSDQENLQRAMAGCDAVFHGAAIYKVGIPRSEQEQMYDTNVRGTERVLDAAFGAGVPRIVYVSTVNVFGNTGGDVVDESYKRDTSGNGFLSYYDETKWKAHEVALDRIGQGAPV